MTAFLKKQWFMVGLIVVAAVTLADQAGWIVPAGQWLKTHRGPDVVIVLIFFFSGLALDPGQVKKGLGDVTGTLTGLMLIFGAAPALAFVFGLIPMETGLMVGLFLVAVMPTTLSSGVVMTGAAGGNMAHALLITILANALAVVTIPFSLTLLLKLAGINRIVTIDTVPMMIKIATRVLVPLTAGLTVRSIARDRIRPVMPYVSIVNQSLILCMVWMAMCESRTTILANASALPPVVVTAFFFHFVLVLTGLGAARAVSLPPGRRESVVLMGGQKTLPLAVILQVTLFAQYGVALAFCVLHHIIHLIMDAYLAQWFRARMDRGKTRRPA